MAETTEEEYDNCLAINAKIPFFLMRETFSKMADNGRVINLVTTQVAVTAPTYAAYAGSKAPVEHAMASVIFRPARTQRAGSSRCA